MVDTEKTYCRNCGGFCGIELDVENNKIIAVRGDNDNAASQGYFCVKGYSSMDFHNGEDRLLNCKKRLPDGSFANIEQEQLLDEIAEKLRLLIDQYGPRSVALFNGTHSKSTLVYSMTKSLMDSIGSPNTFSTMTIDQSAKWVCNGRMGVVPTGKYRDEDADVLMLVGNNPAVSHMSIPWSGIRNAGPMRAAREAKRRGMKLIVVDPRLTETARQADIHVRIKPGDDPILFAGLIRLVIENGWYDKAFCTRYTAQFEQLIKAVEPFNVDYVAKRIEVPSEQLIEVARVFGTASKSSAGTGTGANMNRNSNLSEHMVEAFNAICGGFRKAGDTVTNPGLMSGSVPKTFGVFPANRTWEREPKAVSDGSIGQLKGEFPSGILNEEITSDSPNRIRALIALGGNPVMALGDPDKTVPAFKELDLLITIDPRLTESALLSDYVVAPSLPYERHDCTLISDLFHYLPFAQYAPPAITPPPGVLPDWEFIWGLGKRLGCQFELRSPFYGTPFSELPEGYTLNMEQKPDPEELIDALCKQSHVSLDVLKAHPSGFAPVSTPMRIAEPEEDDGARLSLMPDDVAQELAAELREQEHNSEFPLLLSCRRMLEAMNGSFRDAGRTRKRFKSNPLYMHPDDIERYHLENSETVLVESKFGRVSAVLKQDLSMKPGVVAITHMWGSALDDSLHHSSGTNVGRLISLTENRQAINRMPLFSGVEVRVFRLDGHTHHGFATVPN